ncbi:hypothetical protein ACFSQP_08580 [Bizionia sediminis]|uniref:Lipoprotein n=1 Tax=Bizionia sediminis TaxID=1737064 RepID=A0ABW5KTE4_9FLAO
MKNYILIACALVILQSCKTDKTEHQNMEPSAIPEKTPAQKIAAAYGVHNWHEVDTLEFAFNVKQDSTIFTRFWQWLPKKDKVRLISQNDTIHYNRNNIDSLALNADKAFINDKFWLLAPFNLVWDTGTTISEPQKELAPISQQMRHKITITYSNEGGYTPGDAYDIYYNNNFLIEEWVYRKANAPAPTMTTTWENNTEFKGVLLALNHKKPNQNWELFFTNVAVK